MRHSNTFFNEKQKNENSPIDIKKINNEFINNNENIQLSKQGVALVKKSSFKTSDKSNIKKTATLDEPKKTFKEGLLELIENICLYDIKKIQKILLIYPINNMRWIIWLAMAKVKYRGINNKINISNKEIYEDLTNKMEFNDDSLLFELHN